MKVSLYRDFTFEAAHANPHAAKGTPQARTHGHSYQVRVHVQGEIDPELGWLIDFAEVRRRCRPVIEKVDHRLLNDVPGIDDASLAGLNEWMRIEFTRELPLFSQCQVRILGETSFDPEHAAGSETGAGSYLRFGFAAAHSLPMVGPDHKCARLHGHSYRVIVGAPEEALPKIEDTVRGMYPSLGHSVLNELPGLENPTAERLAKWLAERLIADGCTVRRIEVGETCTSGCVYSVED